MMLLFFFCLLQSLFCNAHDYQWAVIGGGPAGIIAVTHLLENKVQPMQIIWYDPEFDVGRLGKFYRNVPANSSADEMFAFFKSSPILASYSSASIDLLNTFDEYEGFYLRTVISPLKEFTYFLWDLGVRPVTTRVHELNQQEDAWRVITHDFSCSVNAVILATGAQPIIQNYPGPKMIPLDIALDEEKLAASLTLDDVVAVIGSGSSSLLLLKYLSELPLKKVINFYKHHHTQARQRSLIRGETDRWIRTVLDKSPPENLFRVRNTQENRNKYLPFCTKIIYAIGYTHHPLPKITGDFHIPSPNRTGILGHHLFGIGIAFPEEITYPNGKELVKIPLIGINSFMHFAKKVIPQWIKNVS